jgi:hypothetical protein
MTDTPSSGWPCLRTLYSSAITSSLGNVSPANSIIPHIDLQRHHQVYAISLLVTCVLPPRLARRPLTVPVLACRSLNTRENIRRARSTSSGERGPVLYLETRPQKTSTHYYGGPSTPVRDGLKVRIHTSHWDALGLLIWPRFQDVQINVRTSVEYDTEMEQNIEPK